MTAPADYELVFSDEFDTLSLSNGRIADANWYAGLAWGGGFGAARFLPVGGSRSPFAIVEQGGESALRIEMSRNAEGVLESGLISNTFPDGTSKTPQDGDPYGYYEARLWLPEGRGIWPAFWSIEAERLSAGRDRVVEVDVMEHYGAAMPDRYTSHVHLWDWNGSTLEGHTSAYQRHVAGPDVLAAGWHTYGIEVRPDTMTFTFDGVAYWSIETPAALDSDPMVMLNLAAGGGWPIDPALDRVALYVDYFRAYELRDGPTGHMLLGTSGDDVFRIDDGAMRILEPAGGGLDTVRTGVSYILPDNVENLVICSSGVVAGTGNDAGNQLHGGAGANRLSGLRGDDGLWGAGGNDTLSGGAGADRIRGGDGRDLILGGPGIDRLYGEAGADVFRFRSVAESALAARDTIFDFSGAEGDRIDLSGLDADPSIAGVQSFAFVGSQSFSAAAQLRFANGVLSGDVDSDGTADFGIAVRTGSLGSGDLIL